MFKIILDNLFGYDLIIIVIAILAGFIVLPRASKASEALKKQLQPTLYVPIDVLLGQFKNHKQEKVNLQLIKELKDDEVKFVSILVTVMSVFPLLGILGTIISLLRMVDLGSQEVLINFTTALTSTFWGLVFAILFKGLTSSLLAQSDQNSENFELLVKRLDLLNGSGDDFEEK